MFCPRCGNQVDDNAFACPRCGEQVGRRQGQAPPYAQGAYGASYGQDGAGYPYGQARGNSPRTSGRGGRPLSRGASNVAYSPGRQGARYASNRALGGSSVYAIVMVAAMALALAATVFLSWVDVNGAIASVSSGVNDFMGYFGGSSAGVVPTIEEAYPIYAMPSLADAVGKYGDAYGQVTSFLQGSSNNSLSMASIGLWVMFILWACGFAISIIGAIKSLSGTKSPSVLGVIGMGIIALMSVLSLILLNTSYTAAGPAVILTLALSVVSAVAGILGMTLGRRAA